jgi:nucleotide-binding universal stress UspA family protein
MRRCAGSANRWQRPANTRWASKPKNAILLYEYETFHSREPSALDYTLGGFPENEQDRAKEEASSILDEAVAQAKRTFLEIDSRLRTGRDLRHEILSTAKEISADLLVLTTHKFAVWKNLLFGSDAEEILEHAQCPILILRF